MQAFVNNFCGADVAEISTISYLKQNVKHDADLGKLEKGVKEEQTA